LAPLRAQLGALGSEDPEEEKRQKDFKSLLNKITLDNYETIRDKITGVGITSPVTLRGLIDQARSFPFHFFPFIAFLWVGVGAAGSLQPPMARCLQCCPGPCFQLLAAKPACAHRCMLATIPGARVVNTTHALPSSDRMCTHARYAEQSQNRQ
jgi:hypothetical protein